MDLQTTSLLIAAKSSGLSVESSDIALGESFTFEPSTEIGGGVNCEGALFARVEIVPYLLPRGRQVIITMDAVDIGSIYTFITDDIDGNPLADVDYDSTGDVTIADIVTGWATAINAATGYSDRVIATAIDRDGDSVMDALQIRPANVTSPPSFAVSTDGSSDITANADGISFQGGVFVRPIGSQEYDDTQDILYARRAWKVASAVGGGTYFGQIDNQFSAVVDLRGCAGVTVAGAITGGKNDDGIILHGSAHIHVFTEP